MNQQASVVIDYEEELPEACPPVTSQDLSISKACRFYFYPDGDERNYFSHVKLGKPIGDASPCEAASVSFQTMPAAIKIKEAKKLPRFKDKKVAVHDFPSGVAMSLKNSKGHIHVWPYKGVDLGAYRNPTLYDCAEDLINDIK